MEVDIRQDETGQVIAAVEVQLLAADFQGDRAVFRARSVGFVAEGGDRKLLGQVGREYLNVLKSVQIEDFSRIDRRAVEKLSGYQQARGKLREIMRSVQYPEGYFYVERTLVLLFGLVGQLAPKKGLPGLLLPYASKVFLQGFAPPAPGAADDQASA